jgi:hypothetical protein
MVVNNPRPSSPGEKMVVDRVKPRRIKSKPVLGPTIDPSLPGQSIRMFERNLLKTSKAPHDTRAKLPQKQELPEAVGPEQPVTPSFGGPLAQAEFDRLRAELERYKQVRLIFREMCMDGA